MTTTERLRSRVLLVVLLVTLAGCAGGETGTPAETSSTTPGSDFDSGSNRTPTAIAAPEPPADLTNESAKRVALEAERAHVFDILREHTDRFSEWGVGAWSNPDAVVIDETDGGVYVEVEMPYSYQAGASYVDAVATAVYLVSEDEVRRVDGEEVAIPDER